MTTMTIRNLINKPTFFLAMLGFVLLATPVFASELGESIFALPEWDDLLRVLSLRDYNTRVVVVGTTLLGVASGFVGTFLLLRKRALLSDAISHATLPGIGLAFLLLIILGGNGKNFVVLLMGAAVTGTLGMLAVLGISNYTRLKNDTALAVVLSVFFAVGIALVGIVSRLPQGNAAGLETYIYGKTASMLMNDAILIAGTTAVVSMICLVLFKEFALLCFDQNFASATGWPVVFLDLLMMVLIVVVTVIGLQAVGLILVVALLIIPPAAARFWSDDLRIVFAASGFIGGMSGLLGCTISALMENLPAGAVIVLAATFFFLLSLCFGLERGLFVRMRKRQELDRRVGRQNLLRAIYEIKERADDKTAPVPVPQVIAKRSWKAKSVNRLYRQAAKLALITRTPENAFSLTKEGEKRAARIVRNHRLWEMYLITHADIAPNHVDRDADMIEHILDEELIAELERLVKLKDDYQNGSPPPSPHEDLNFRERAALS